jgi:xylulokinase
MKKIIAGLDVGTSSVKAVLFDEEGYLIAQSSLAIPQYSPFPGWAEQDPLDWWSAACVALKGVMQNIDPGELAALGLSGQCPGHVLVDGSGNALGRAIIWRDQRAQEEAQWLAETITAEQSLAWVGKDTLGEATLPPARLLWLKRHVPEVMDKCKVILQAKDFIGLKLTGVAATDINSAYCLYNSQTECYNPDFFAALGVPVEIMPDVLQPTDALGTVNRAASLETGLPEGLAIICGTIDAYCDNLACGAIIPGVAVDVAGTSEVVSLGVKQANKEGNFYLAGIGQMGHFLCGPTQAGSDTLRWLGQGFYPEFSDPVNFDRLEQDASTIPPGSDGLVFLPYLNGERAPLWDSSIRGGFIGFTFSHQRAHCARAVYEGIGYAVRHILDVFGEMSGQSTTNIILCGGGAKSSFWNQIKADILQCPASVLEVNQTACLGAAMLSCVGAGIYPDIASANQRMTRLKATIIPNPANAGVYEEAYRQYRALYPALRPLFHKNESKG